MRIEVPEWPIWNNPAYPDINALNILDHKSGHCIGYVVTDDGCVHFAIQFGQAVIAFEHIPVNYPATSVAFYVSRVQWINAIKDCDWIVEGLRAESIAACPECPEELLKPEGEANHS